MPIVTAFETCKSRAEVLGRIKRIIIDNLNLDLTEDQIDDDSPLFGTGLGLDSIDALDLVIGVEEGFSIKVGEDELHVFKSVNSLVDFVLEKQSGGIAAAPSTLDWSQAELDGGGVLSDSGIELYRTLRTSTILTDLPQTLLRFPEGDATLEALSEVLTGKLTMLEPSRILHTALVDEDGMIVDLVYVFQFEDHFWVAPTPGKQESLDRLRDLAVECDLVEDLGCILLEGPYSWSLAKDVFGFEVLGLSYQRFIELSYRESNLVLARLSTTGEYGFRIYLPLSLRDALAKELRDNGSVVFREPADHAEFLAVRNVSAMEMRTPLLDVTVPSGSDVAENELRWMVDHGNDALAAKLGEPVNRVVGVRFDGAREPVAPGIDLFLGDRAIGKVVACSYSPSLGAFIGLASLELEFGYAGIEGLRPSGREDVHVSTVSTPFLLPASSRVQMQ